MSGEKRKNARADRGHTGGRDTDRRGVLLWPVCAFQYTPRISPCQDREVLTLDFQGVSRLLDAVVLAEQEAHDLRAGLIRATDQALELERGLSALRWLLETLAIGPTVVDQAAGVAGEAWEGGAP